MHLFIYRRVHFLIISNFLRIYSSFSALLSFNMIGQNRLLNCTLASITSGMTACNCKKKKKLA